MKRVKGAIDFLSFTDGRIFSVWSDRPRSELWAAVSRSRRRWMLVTRQRLKRLMSENGTQYPIPRGIQRM